MRRWWIRTVLVLVGLAFLFGVVLLVWLAPPALYKGVEAKDGRASAEATTRNGFVLGLAGLAALAGLAFTARTYRLTEQGQLTDRYTKAIEQLGAGKLDVRLGGIYALERIARDSKRDHGTVIQVLSAFVRERSNQPRQHRRRALASNSERRPTADIQAAVTVLGTLPRQRIPRTRMWTRNWRSKRFGSGIKFGRVVSRALLRTAKLSGAELSGLDLSGADLSWADLSYAVLSDANLSYAMLIETNLSNARLHGANLRGAAISDFHLDGTNLPTGLQGVYWSHSTRWPASLDVEQLQNNSQEAPPGSGLFIARRWTRGVRHFESVTE